MEKLGIYQQQNHVLLKFGDSALLKTPKVLSIKPPKTKYNQKFLSILLLGATNQIPCYYSPYYLALQSKDFEKQLRK